jgi:hypothetical protein
MEALAFSKENSRIATISQVGNVTTALGGAEAEQDDVAKDGRKAISPGIE